MMRGWIPLFVTVAALTALSPAAHAQPAGDEDDDDEPAPVEQPVAPIPPSLPSLPPTYAMPPICCVEQPEPQSTSPREPQPRKLLLQLSIGPTYRRAFGEDWAAVVPELEIGGQSRNFSVGARFSAAIGGTRVGLPYQHFNFGPGFMFRLSPRWRFGFGVSFGIMMYERASATAATDPVVDTITFGATLDATVDVVRTRGGGAVYLGARGGWDWIMTINPDFIHDSSLAATALVGWRL